MQLLIINLSLNRNRIIMETNHVFYWSDSDLIGDSRTEYFFVFGRIASRRYWTREAVSVPPM